MSIFLTLHSSQLAGFSMAAFSLEGDFFGEDLLSPVTKKTSILVTRASTKGRDKAAVAVRRFFITGFLGVRIVHRPLRSHKLGQERGFFMPH